MLLRLFLASKGLKSARFRQAGLKVCVFTRTLLSALLSRLGLGYRASQYRDPSVFGRALCLESARNQLKRRGSESIF